WWADDMDDFTEGNRDKWKWTMMIMQPDWITQEIINEAIKNTIEKSPELEKVIAKLRFEKYKEGKAAQIMHIGPYSEEGPNIEKIHNFIKSHGGSFNGRNYKHHEIYLSDPRKAKPENMKTVIRQPFN
ncbi:MAG: GyrI-like domain-containing protein, partial [Promethearchaeota archaeon]